MRFSSVTIAFSALAQLALGKYNCTTRYASTSNPTVKTYYSTSTKFTVTSSYTYGTQYNPTSTGISYTFISVTGKKTKTLPTGPSFTPIYRAPPGPPPPFKKRSPAPSPLPSAQAVYPSAVVCSTTVTAGTYTQIGTATATYTRYTTKQTFRQTTTSASVTSYAACAPSNIITATKGQQINYFWMDDSTDICDYNEQRYAGEQWCGDASTCCNYAQANDWGGFVWLNFTESIHCYLFVGYWGFQTGPQADQPYYVGNGPEGSGYYGPPS